ncbi:MAG: phosphodiester glycosidase family protein [Bacteroidales bacterium]|jgi:hypothetical protein|nr:phosphodiester glycosidase family protein [Bacteroidales bacterium]
MKLNKLLLVIIIPLLVWDCASETPIRAILVNPDALSMITGETKQVTAEPEPSDANPAEKPFKWESSNVNVAAVSASGRVTAISAGMTEIIVSARVSSNIEKKIPVTVADLTIPLTAIRVSPESVTLYVNGKERIFATPEPSDATDVSFSWSSDNPNVATVSSVGLVMGITEGTTTVRVKSRNIEKEIPVTVFQKPFSIILGSTDYTVDTIAYEEISPGVKWLKFSLPEYVNSTGTLGKGLVSNIVEIDLSHEGNRLEVCPASQATQGNVERPTAMYARKNTAYSASGRKVVVAINGDFYLVTNTTGYSYINNRPLGMEIGNGMLVQTPFSSNYGFVFKDNQTPSHGTVTYSGTVDAAGNRTFPLAEVNGFADRGKMVLFNNLSNSYPTDSAFAWSPYTSTMVSLSSPEGGWRVNDRMEFTVTKIEHGIETAIPAQYPNSKGKNFNGEGAILVGNSLTTGSSGEDSYTFLSSLQEGDKIGVTMSVKLDGTTLTDRYLNVIGYRTVILQRGVSVNNWNEDHPRTAIGYSQDGRKIYLLVVDGRQTNYSVGAVTDHIAAILKAFGAYTAVNLDGGGSSCMVINGEIKNKPSGGTERAVANGIIVTVNKQ